MELSFEEAATGLTTKIRVPRQEFLRILQRHRRESRHRRQRLPAMRRARSDALPAGIFRDFADVPRMPRCGTGGAREMSRRAAARAASKKPRRSNCEFRPAWIRRRGCACPAKAKWVRTAGRRAICTSCCEVREHPFFERRNADLYCTIPISVTQAALGAEVSVPGLAGEEKVKIPEGTQTGSIFPPEREGIARPARRRQRRSLRERARRDAGETESRAAPHARAIGTDARSRQPSRTAQQFILRQSQRHLRITPFSASGVEPERAPAA